MYILDYMNNKQQPKETMKKEIYLNNKDDFISKKLALHHIKVHGNLDEIKDFYKVCGDKTIYTIRELKNWLGY